MGFIADSDTEFWICPCTDGRVYDLQAKSTALRRTWMEAIAATILEIQRTRRSPNSPQVRRTIHDFVDRSTKSVSNLNKSGSFTTTSDGPEDNDHSTPHHSPAAPPSPKTPQNLMSPESKSLLALRALIQHKQQALAESKTDEPLYIPTISLLPAEHNGAYADANANADSQVMEKLKQIQKLLAATAAV